MELLDGGQILLNIEAQKELSARVTRVDIQLPDGEWVDGLQATGPIPLIEGIDVHVEIWWTNEGQVNMNGAVSARIEDIGLECATEQPIFASPGNGAKVLFIYHPEDISGEHYLVYDLYGVAA